MTSEATMRTRLHGGFLLLPLSLALNLTLTLTLNLNLNLNPVRSRLRSRLRVGLRASGAADSRFWEWVGVRGEPQQTGAGAVSVP